MKDSRYVEKSRRCKSSDSARPCCSGVARTSLASHAATAEQERKQGLAPATSNLALFCRGLTQQSALTSSCMCARPRLRPKAYPAWWQGSIWDEKKPIGSSLPLASVLISLGLPWRDRMNLATITAGSTSLTIGANPFRKACAQEGVASCSRDCTSARGHRPPSSSNST